MKHAPHRPRQRRQAGFTIVEMMVAMSIGLIVMLGFTATFVSMKTTFNSQDQFSQLQDNERLAMAILTSSMNEAGYYPNPWSAGREQILTSTDPVGGVMNGSQIIGGTAATGTNPETLSTAYASATGDGLLTCQGGTNTSGANLTLRNTFYVDSSTNSLGCNVMSGTTSLGFQPLVSGVQSMSVLYGLDANGNGQIDKYLNVTDMAASGLWANVKSVRVTLVFTNPFAAQQPTRPTITWVQTVNLMNNR